jgi:hypothetical protein
MQRTYIGGSCYRLGSVYGILPTDLRRLLTLSHPLWYGARGGHQRNTQPKKGVYTDYSTHTFTTAKYAAPSLAAIALVLGIATFNPGSPSTPNAPIEQTPRAAESTSETRTVNSPPNETNNPTDTTAERTTTRGTAAASAAPVSNQPNTSAPPQGGRGAGEVESIPSMTDTIMSPPTAPSQETATESQPSTAGPMSPEQPTEPAMEMPMLDPIIDEMQP